MARFVDEALAYLKSIFVTDLSQWQERVSWTMNIPKMYACQTHKLPWEPAAAIGVVNIARLAGCTSPLPTALLVCCALRENLIQGFEREDGTREKLTEDDFIRCYAATPALMVASAARCLLTLIDHDLKDMPSCETEPVCREGMRRLPFELGLQSYLVAAIDPFWPWQLLENL